MNLFTDELIRMRQGELLAEAEASRCCRPTGGRSRRSRRGWRRLVNGAGGPTRRASA